VPPKQLIARRSDIVDAVFDRSFNKLSLVGRWIFLLVANWASPVPELALLVVVGQRGLGFDVEAGIDECVRLSLIGRDYLSDSHPVYSAPYLSRVFGKKKLTADPYRLSVEEDLRTIQQFGVIRAADFMSQGSDQLVAKFVAGWKAVHAGDKDSLDKWDALLEAVAQLWPPGWLELARFRKAMGADTTEVQTAFRRAVEEMPFSSEAWMERAEYAGSVGDELTQIASLISAVEAAPTEVSVMREAATQLVQYVNSHKGEIAKTRRGVYLASVRARMVEIADQLDAGGLSRLAWLFLLEGDEAEALRYATEGLRRDPTDVHCKRMVDRLKKTGTR
jgi:hypothetical protein